ncbi:MAG TPA: GlcNAc-transferase family protein [Acetobacteraceae bacterium]|nr:GlcNAc-transferase family protein [Acetobacteraceae bacterium]
MIGRTWLAATADVAALRTSWQTVRGGWGAARRDARELIAGVCWQQAGDELAPADFTRPRVRVIDVPWNQSRGVCWARAEIMKLWNGEDFFLQLDSKARSDAGAETGADADAGSESAGNGGTDAWQTGRPRPWAGQQG